MYLKFFQLAEGISQLEKFPSMTHLSKIILDHVALNELQSHPLSVRQLIAIETIASPATIHKHLSSLRKSGYVGVVINKIDKRTKPLVLTPLGHQYIDALSKALQKSLKI
jgi:DNA-binding MarR family transcriptional regulator